jgi:hypothetical protein
MPVQIWTGAINSNWARPGNWSPGGAPDANTDVVINIGAPVAAASIGTVDSIMVSADLSFESVDPSTVTTFLYNSGQLYADDIAGDGGTILNIGGTLTNSGDLAIGNATLSASDIVTAASLDNTGLISLTGSGANQALLDVTGAAGFGTAKILSGDVQLANDSAIEFLSGPITTIALASQLTLDGNAAFVEDSTGLGSNSALTGLANVAGALDLENGASVSTGALANSGALYVDYSKGDGGSSLTVDGTLKNTSFLILGNSSLSTSDSVTASSLVNASSGLIDLTGGAVSAQALLSVTAGAAGFGAAGTLMGTVQLSGDSAVEFASGQIATIAESGVLELDGRRAFIEDSGALGSNSALMGLTDVAGTLEMYGNVSVTTTGALLDSGSIYLAPLNGAGASILSTDGAISDSGALSIGEGCQVTTTALNNTGSIDLTGAGANQALLDVTTGVAGFGTAGTVTGTVDLHQDAAIEFLNGQISTISAASQLLLDGNNAFIEDKTALGSNSALAGLADVAGSLDLANGAVVSTIEPLTNTGSIDLTGAATTQTLLDVTTGAAGFGTTGTVTGTVDLSLDSAIEFLNGQISTIGAGSKLNLDGNNAFIEDRTALGSNSALTELADVAGSLDLGDGAVVSTIGPLTNTGSIDLTGAATIQTLLDVTTGAAGFGTTGTVTGTVDLHQDAAIEFLNGQISTISAASQLLLDGNNAFIEDSTALGSNSALTGLAKVDGSLDLEENASVSTTGTGPLADSGVIGVFAGSALSIAGQLQITKTGKLHIGVSGLSSSDSVTAESFVNSGTVDLIGDGANLSALNVSGTTTNDGAISIASDTETLAGAIVGTGSFSLSNANLLFDSSVAVGQTINEIGADELTLKHPRSFRGTISGFGIGDTIDVTNFHKFGTTLSFVENSGGTEGTLTLRDAGLTAHILMTGVYSDSNFHLTHDAGSGTLVHFVA